jgi:hypothetical protein
MIKARHAREDYIFALLTGYREPPAGVVVNTAGGQHYNPYFAGGKIGMAKQLTDGMVEYPDGTPATESQMAAPKPKIKKEGQRTKAVAEPRAAAAQADTDDEVQISAVQPNKNSDINFWKEQSANELRAQLKLRDLQKFRNEWAFKSKDQLLQIIQDMISKGTW